MRRLILASTSPRRAELLRQIGVAFELRAVEVDESPRPGEAAAETALRLAVAKAEAGRSQAAPGQAVLAADTLVSLDGEPLGKPRDREDFFVMLRRLSGRRHEVCTAVALAWDDSIRSFLSVSHVDFRPLLDAELAAYWATGEPKDKAGGYAIQGRAAVFITRLEGSFSGVMGLPLFETAELLQQAGFRLWSTAG
ncbi:MAG: Maf family protein [Gammaproteobacteria bacterium]|nr:Maf family protein [Gammaproteobacteria bacterium]